MKNLLFLLSFLLLSIFGSCKAQDPEPLVSQAYESCCGVEPVEFTTGNAYIFVPNVFTPNSDGINDYFVPSFNDGILGFDSYLIYTPVGDTLVFATSDYDPNNIANTAWNGLKQDGAVYTGAFKYEFILYLKDGGRYRVQGQACRIVCGPEAEVFKTKIGCFYPSQISTTGHLDLLVPSQEEDCFK